METYVHTETCTQVFMQLYIYSPKTRKNSNVPQWWMTVQTVVHLHKLLMHAAMWMNPETLCWVKEAALKRLRTVWFSLSHILERQTAGMENGSALARVWGWGRGVDYKGVAWGNFLALLRTLHQKTWIYTKKLYIN